MSGKVYLVGAGPGDPGLITVKGRQLIEEADIIIYDYLVNEALLEYCKPDAEKIYVGKKAGFHSMSQEEINRLLVEKGRFFKVVRLKGGDPFVFGRGGEEAQALTEAGIEFEVVPGVTSAIAAPAYGGIPLSHRDFNSTITFVTGHERGDGKESKINWKALSMLGGTLVFLMGMKQIEDIVDNLVKNGVDPQTPAAVIQWGTTPKQKTVAGTLSNIIKLVQERGITSPSVIVIGDVVKLRDPLNWFERKPLFGKTIVITRARAQASKFKTMLEELGASCFEFPTIEIEPPPSWEFLDRAISELHKYDWIIFTSVNGVKFFFERLWLFGLDGRSLWRKKIAAIGSETARALENVGIRADFVPASYKAEGLLEGLEEDIVKDKYILIPRALEARDILPGTLRKRGAHVEVVPTYKTTIPTEDKSRLLFEKLKRKEIDCITFTSSSTVHNFFALMGDSFFLKNYLRDVAIACIGPITAKTAREYDLDVKVVPSSYTIEGLRNALVEYFSSRVTSL